MFIAIVRVKGLCKHVSSVVAAASIAVAPQGDFQRMPKGGGGKPHGELFPTPLASVRFAPPYSISLSKSLRNPRIFPQLTTS